MRDIVKSSQNHHIFSKIIIFPAHLLPPRAPHQQLWLRWRPLAAAEAGLTAARAAGMPVRRSRRPAAVSAADAETDLELSCGALENDRAVRPPIGEVKFALGGCVGLSVDLSVGSGRGIEPVVLVCVLSGRLCVLGLCVSGVSESGFFCLRPCLCAEVGLRLCVCAPFGAIPPSRNPLVLPFRSLVRSRLRSRGYGKRRCRARLRLRLRLRWVVGWVLLVGAQSRTRARVE